MGLAVWGASIALEPWLTGPEVVRFPALAALVAAGLAIYALLALATRAVELADLRGLLRRRGARPT